MELTIRTAPPGIYWCRYKDHGWRLIHVMEKMSYQRQAKEIDDYFNRGHDVIPREDWGKYIDLRKLEEPQYGK